MRQGQGGEIKGVGLNWHGQEGVGLGQSVDIYVY